MLQAYWDSEAIRSVLRNLQHKLDPGKSINVTSYNMYKVDYI